MSTASSRSAAPPDSPLQGEQKMRLLLVEDEPVQRMMLECVLRRAGYEVTTANDGAARCARWICATTSTRCC